MWDLPTELSQVGNLTSVNTSLVTLVFHLNSKWNARFNHKIEGNGKQRRSLSGGT